MELLNVCAPGRFDFYDSYGLIACRLVRHLSALGVHVNALAPAETAHATLPGDVAELIRRPIRFAWGGLCLGYPTGYPMHLPFMLRGPKVALTMFESSRIPPAWVEPLNRMDAVVVPSRFCAGMFRECGVTTPIHVIALGVSEVYTPVARAPGPPSAERPLVVLAFLDRGKRKGGMWAVPAFVRAFGEDPAYQLILKTRSRPDDPDRPRIAFGNANITLVQQDMTEAELHALYASADVLLNPNMGEGFGLIPREFAATGGISLVTDWGGTADDLDEWGFGLPSTLVEADWAENPRLAGLPLGHWAMPDIDGAAAVLRQVATYRERFASIALRSARRVAELYAWPAFAAQVLDLWRSLQKEEAHAHDRRTAAAA